MCDCQSTKFVQLPDWPTEGWIKAGFGAQTSTLDKYSYCNRRNRNQSLSTVCFRVFARTHVRVRVRISAKMVERPATLQNGGNHTEKLEQNFTLTPALSAAQSQDDPERPSAPASPA